MIKRAFDLLIVLVTLPVWGLALAIVAVLVWRRVGRPIVFAQVRPGLNERSFTMLKFRSMTDAKDQSGGLLPDNERLNHFGRWLRSTSLDELPELWNVLKGEMSLVGPRPLLMEYLPLYTAEQSRRHAVRPGITGWAQINGRNAITWPEKLRLDVWYVDHHSLWLDVRILSLTVLRVLRRHGVSAAGEATTTKFTGDVR